MGSVNHFLSPLKVCYEKALKIIETQLWILSCFEDSRCVNVSTNIKYRVLKNHQLRGNRGRVKNLVWCGEIKVAHINDTVVKPGLASRSKHIFVNVASLECKIPPVYEHFLFIHSLLKFFFFDRPSKVLSSHNQNI